MSANPFSFLIDLPDTEARQWLARYLRDEGIVPTIEVPFDLQRLDFLLGEVNPLPTATLPIRIGDLAGGLLAEAILRAGNRAADARFLMALFALLESLPVSESVGEFLNDLVISGRLLAWPIGDDADFHLLALRVLVLHQRPVADNKDRLIDLWKRETRDLRYASIAIQGMLRAAPGAAIAALPDFVERALAARPPLPITNLLFAFSVELGDDQRMWERLIAGFVHHPKAFEAVKQTLKGTRIARPQTAAWEVLHPAARRSRKRQDTAPVMFIGDGLFPPSVEQSSFEHVPTYSREYRGRRDSSRDELVLSVTSRQREYRPGTRVA